MVSWNSGKGGRVVTWQDGKDRRVVRWKGVRFLGLFNGWDEVRVREFIFLFLMLIKGNKGRSDVNQGNKQDGLQISLRACTDGKILLRSSASC